MSHRRFVQFNTDTGNIFSIMESAHPPGDIAESPDLEVIQDDVREVTDEPHRADEEWLRYRWTGSAFVERDDQPEPSAATAGIEDRLSNIEAMLEQLTSNQ
jgi:hypothetical protein